MDCAVLRLGCDLDLATAASTLRLVQTGIDRHTGSVVLDMQDVQFMDSSGLNALLRAKSAVESSGQQFSLTNLKWRYLRLFRMMRLDELFRVDPLVGE